ncbi:MAG: UDP-glucose/GDP-mannose dehydrogenase family protein [Candidatus Amulumruptor caecigallinarius]|nr:UDP-glucose/GDP-mannose dehydrogenase family protein [Candidatus Amulumruptor caecigallinarius]MCM1396635.1 UDP-glucose/GDP-mannose dehydrogenase family protein [Candidatus Amulumruptor caecigallinarius]MCM1453307.1 UDP-glucose/GDP-mannose dehydrogenase family protein [bacterium]
MNIAIVGTGYVGLVSGACFAEMGVNVSCVDVDTAKVNALKSGNIPIYEPGLDEIVRRNVVEGRLKFTTDLAEVIDDAEIVFSAVGTPPDEDGSADLRYVMEVARTFGRHINRYTLLVTKSTVPVGTAAKVRRAIAEELAARGADVEFDVASNPEFLKEGAAIADFMSPDRVVVGVDSERARELMARLYRPFLLNNFRVIFTDIPSAEMIKYAANSMLATRISFMNDIANLCELVGADVNMVRKGLGSDSRIGSKFLYPGCGYGGSCFPKDVKALIKTAQKAGYDMAVLRAVEEVNDRQKHVPVRKLTDIYGPDLTGRTVALWGLAFKPETDDMREATSLVAIRSLLDAGARVRVFDPVAMAECRRRLGDSVEYATDPYDALIDADAMLMLTEWKQFRMPSWEVVKRTMRRPVIIDGRNIYDPAELQAAGIEYHCIGR